MLDLTLITLLEIFFKTILVVAIVWLSARMLTTDKADVRHLLWNSALIILLLLPLVAHLLPDLRIPVLPDLFEKTEILQEEVVVASAVSSDGSSDEFSLISFLQSNWKLITICTWLTGIMIVSGWIIAGRIRVERLIWASLPVIDKELTSLAQHCAGEIAVDAPELLYSSELKVPLVARARKPVIILPKDMLSVDAGMMKSILLHEMAHIRHGDLFIQWFSMAALSLQWFNPLIWLAIQQQKIASEEAADRHVLSLTGEPALYAEHLLAVALCVTRKSLPFNWASSMARGEEFKMRIKSILKNEARPKPLGIFANLLITMAIALIVIPIAAWSPWEGHVDQDKTKKVKPVKAKGKAPLVKPVESKKPVEKKPAKPAEAAKPEEEALPAEPVLPVEKALPAEPALPAEKALPAEPTLPEEKTIPVEPTLPEVDEVNVDVDIVYDVVEPPEMEIGIVNGEFVNAAVPKVEIKKGIKIKAPIAVKGKKLNIAVAPNVETKILKEVKPQIDVVTKVGKEIETKTDVAVIKRTKVKPLVKVKPDLKKKSTGPKPAKKKSSGKKL